MRNQLIALALLLSTMLALASCGGAARPHRASSPSPSSGVYGISVTTPYGVIPATQSPSPLPEGFGVRYLVPAGNATIFVKVVGGIQAGQIVARVKADSQGIFRVSLPPGTYSVYGKHLPEASKTVTVSAGAYKRVVVQTFIHF